MSKLISGIKELYVSYAQQKKSKEWQGQQGQELAQQGQVIKNTQENFNYSRTHYSDLDIVGLIIAIIIVIILQVVIGKFIWNNYIIRIIPAFKPVHSYADILALFIMVALLL